MEIEKEVGSRFSDKLVQLDNLKKKSVEEKKHLFEKGKEKITSSKVSTHRTDELKHRLLNHIQRVPGLNSGHYDLNLIKKEFHSFYTENDKTEIKTIKHCNQYIAVSTEHSLILDMVYYLVLGYFYVNYLNAFTLNECKGFFPYEWMTSTRKLSKVKLPPRSYFCSSLTGSTISKKRL